MEPFVIREILSMRWSDAGISARDIAKVLAVSHQSVAKITTKAAEAGLVASQLEKFSDLEVMAQLYPKSAGRPLRGDKVEPDFASLVVELSKYPKLTRYLLWCEYQGEVGAKAAYSYSSFCDKLKRFDLGQEITMVLHHGLGKVAMADYAGMTVPIFDQRSGESRPASIFVMSLGNSGYAFVQAHDSQDMANYLKGHADGFTFFEGTPAKIVADYVPRNIIGNYRLVGPLALYNLRSLELHPTYFRRAANVLPSYVWPG